MADEQAEAPAGVDGGGEGSLEQPQKCPVCAPGLPGWMATFSDLVTLLLTFFVLLLSFAKTETAKYEAALGSVRNAFGGNVLVHGEVIQRGKSADNQPTMMESEQIIKPFPIDFLTMEGILDKHEVNRESTEILDEMKGDLSTFNLSDSVSIYEEPEGIKVRVKDKVYFQAGSVKIERVSIEVFERMIKLLKDTDWILFVEGHASKGEIDNNGKDALTLSSQRSMAVMRYLVKRGIKSSRITPVFYGDTSPEYKAGGSASERASKNRRVEFIIRKVDLRTSGHKVESR